MEAKPRSAFMEPHRWQQIELLYHTAVTLEPAQRAALLQETCLGDEALQREVESLLACEEEATRFLEAPAFEVAARALGADRRALVGQRIGAYDVLGHLGAGGMGEVYLARSTALERKVALKLLPVHLTSNEDRLKRFVQEAKVTSTLNHPNIITIHEIGHTDDLHFIVTEFVEGETLRKRMTRGRLGVAEALDIGVQVAAALAAAHEAGVVHRDIKPENVMLRPDGYVKVLDFGLAKLTDHPVPEPTDDGEPVIGLARETMAGVLVGTVRYMSPEQAQGLKVDDRSDIFSLGAVLYEMLAGQPPFEGATSVDLITAICEREPPPLTEERPEIPEALESAVRKALRKGREERYQTAKDFLADLKELRRQLEFDADARRPRESIAPDPFVIAPRRKMPERYRLLVAALGILVVTGTAALAYLRLFNRPPADADTTRRLVVLPFINLKPAAETDFLSYSLAETIAARLGHIRTLGVTPASAVYKYRNQAVDPTSAAQELKANTVLTGNYLKEGDVLRISAQLMDVRTAQAIFQDEFSVNYDRLLTLHDSVARRLISALNLNLSPAELDGLRRDIPSNPLAWELYLRGIDHLEGARLPLAIDALEKSVSLDPQFAWAWTEMGAAYVVNAALRFGGREMYNKAQAAFDRAIALSPADPRPRIMISDMLIETNRVEQAVPILRGIVQQNPRQAAGIWELSYAYRYAGMLEESAQAGQAAYEADPGFTPRSTVFNTWLYLGQYQRFRDTLPQREGSAYLLFYQGFADYHLQNFARAAVAFDRAYSLDPGMLQARVGKALSDRLAGRPAEGLRLMRETAQQLEERGLNDAEGIYKVAQAFAVLGDHASALHWLRASISGGFFCYPYFTTDPLLDNLRHLPEFKAALEQTRQRHEQFKRRFF